MEQQDPAARAGRYSRYLAEVPPGREIRPIRHGFVAQRSDTARLAKTGLENDQHEQTETAEAHIDSRQYTLIRRRTGVVL